ncbi:MAG: prepilin-type N-terminal cleavage/methylation domain-containing protein [Acidobacteria bacterium]|nr:prepilin-type N-terminal cleavage/methylation domain-containing protein [Acidobacteriota bacterium]
MKRQAGFTLMEMMVALAITMVVVAATLSALNDAQRANAAVSQMADMTENLRAGMNMMVSDLVQAGEGVPTGGIPIPSGGSGAPINRPSPPGMNYSFPLGATSLPAASPGAGLGPTMLGQATDIITILYADNTIPLITLPLVSISPSGNSMKVDPSIDIQTGNNAIRPGDLIMFSNAQGNALQTATGISGTSTVLFAANDVFNLNQRSDPQGTIQQLQAPLGSGTYPPTTATRIWMVTYYLDNVTDPQHVRLVRQLNFNPPQPVGEVLENLQISYNFIDGVTNPSNQKSVPLGLSENQIRMVNLFLGSRSNAKLVQINDYYHNNLATQVSLRSLAFVNRYR